MHDQTAVTIETEATRQIALAVLCARLHDAFQDDHDEYADAAWWATRTALGVERGSDDPFAEVTDGLSFLAELHNALNAVRAAAVGDAVRLPLPPQDVSKIAGELVETLREDENVWQRAAAQRERMLSNHDEALRIQAVTGSQVAATA